MAIVANNRQRYASTTAGSTHTLSYTVGSGATLLLVKISLEINAPLVNEGVAEVRWGGSGGTLLTQQAAAAYRTGLARLAYVYTLINPTPATQDIWVSLTLPSTGQGSGSSHLAFEAAWFTGTHGTTPVADADINPTGTTISSVSTTAALTPSGVDNWMEAVVCGGNNTLAITPTSPAVESVADFDHQSLWRVGYSSQDNVDADVTPGWSTDLGGTHVWGLAAVLLAPSAAVASYDQTKFQVFNDDGTGLGEAP